MKNMKKLIALLLAMTMVLSMGMSAFASEPPTGDPEDPPTPAATAYDKPLTITGLVVDDVAHFYQILKWDPDNADQVGGWVATEGFKSYLTKAKLTDILVGTKADPDAEPPVEAKDPTGITSEIAGELARLAKDLTSSDVKVTSATDGAVLQNTEAGLFMAVITPSDPDTVYNPVFVGADFDKNDSDKWAVDKKETYSDKAAAKKSTVELKKTAKTAEEVYQDGEWTTTRIGETVSFTVTTAIPGYGKVYQNPVFKLKDKLTDLELKTDTVKIVAPEKLVEGDDPETCDYKLTATTSGYTISFYPRYLKTLTVPTDVKVTYDAIVTTDAPVHVNVEKNQVSTEFSHNPSDESDHSFKKDETDHYTFTIDADAIGQGGDGHGERTSEIVKVAKDLNGNYIYDITKKSEITETNTWKSPLEGAEFKLYTDQACKNEYIPLKKDGSADSPLVIKSDADGRMTIKGLDAGTYYIKETKAPDGFIKDPKEHKIEIIAETEEVTVTEYTTDGENWSTTKTGAAGEKSYTYKMHVLKTYTVKIDGAETATYHFVNDGPDVEIEWTEHPPVEKPSEIVNTKGTELPSTGGIGTTLFYVVGSALVIGAAVLLISKRRMRTR